MSLQIHIQPGSGVPLYRQLANEVKTAFLSGRVVAGDRLPSVRELATRLGLNPTTVVKAYDVLENERLVVRHQGRGAFVAGGKPPLEPDEKQELLEGLAAQLAIEGRRLGLTEEQLTALLQTELAKLRPAEKAQARGRRP